MLIDIITKEPLEPLTPEIFVIPSAGMERYIAFSIAQKKHICANNLYLFPNAFVHYIFQAVFNDLPLKTVFDPEILCWKLFSLLPEFIKKKEFNHLSSYIYDDPSEVKMFQICKKIADIFDQYTVFRPQMLHNWEKKKKTQNPHEKWQADLWNSVIKNTSHDHRVTLQMALNSELYKNKNKITALPRRIILFGISYLPRFHLDILQIIAPFCEINLFTLNPCRHFWDDIVSEKQLFRKTQILFSDQNKNEKPDLHHFESGNSLLASLGEYGKDFFTLLHSIDTVDNESFINPTDNSLLAAI
ncbi:MAG: exodeoxyribonuclease V subunit gamma, partial [Chitinispirillia bacterium]